MGAIMSDMIVDDLAERPVARGKLPKFGLIAMALAAVVGLGNPAAITTEYQIDTVTSAGR
jgi:hypothetical protein